MGLVSQFKIWALIHAVHNMADDKIVDMIESYQRKEFGERVDDAIKVTADKLMRIALELKRRVR